MTEHFDPYYKWLGISPQNQPPDLYRLLALERFEEDPEVIEAAANRQMTYIQGCATGPYVEHSQKILNEIAAARLCLLNSCRKAEYDSVLRDKIVHRQGGSGSAAVAPVDEEALAGTIRDVVETVVHAPRAAAVARAAPVAPPAPPRPRGAPAGSVIAIQSEPTTRAGRRPQRKRKQPVGVLLLLGLLAAVVVGVGAYFLVRTPGEPPAPPSSLAIRGNPPAQKSALSPPGVRPPVQTGSSGEPANDDGKIVQPGSSASQTPDPGPPAPQPAVGSEELFRSAEEALSRGDLSAAVEALKKIMADPGAPQREQAQNLLGMIVTVTSNDWARQQLSQLNNEGLQAFAERRVQFQLPGLHPALVSVAQESLYRNLPEVMKSRGLNPPGGELPPEQPPPGLPANPLPQPPAQPALEPTEPVELLKARRLKRVWKTWVHQDEARCMELIGTVNDAEKRQRDADKELSAAKKKVELARRSLERDDAAVKRAQSSGSPASGTPEHDTLTDRAAASRDALAAAEADVGRLKQESEQIGKQAGDALVEARALAGGLEDKYRQLAADAQVKEALDQLNQQLGPSEEFNELRSELSRARPK